MNSAFTVAKEGTDQRYDFTNLEAALKLASTLITKETPARFYNELGKLIMESSLSPRLLFTPGFPPEETPPFFPELLPDAS